MNIADAAAQLWPWALLLHAASSLALVSPGTALFLGFGGGRCSLLSWPVVASGLLPGVRVFLVSRRGPLPCCEGIFFPCAARGREVSPYRREDYVFLSWEETAAMSADGRKLYAGGKTVFQAASPREARRWKEEAALLREAGNAGREGALARHGERGDATTAVRRLAILRPWAFALDLLGGGFLLCAYGLLPIALYGRTSFRPAVGWLLLLLATAAAALCLCAVFAHRHAHCAKFRHSLAALHDLFFYPLLAGGAVSLVTRELLAGTDFIAVCATLLSPESFRREARRELYALDQANRSDGRFAEALDRKRKHFLAACARAGTTPAELRPEAAFPQDPQVVGHCPLCNAEFLDPPRDCPSCGVRTVAREDISALPPSQPDRPA